MSINYYLAAPHLDSHKDEPNDYGLHIGKSSVGWGFSWAAHPSLGIESRNDWEDFFSVSGDAAILDEYGRFTTLAEFRELAFRETRDPENGLRYDIYPEYGDYLDPRGERFHRVVFF